LHPKREFKNPLVLIFANRMLLGENEIINEIKNEFPYNRLVFGSTSGEIVGNRVFDDSIVVTAIEFENSSFEIRTENILAHNKDAKKLGRTLRDAIPKEILKHLFVLSEGSFINGSSLIEGSEQNIENTISISGGMCGDDARFEKILASYKVNPKEGELVLIGSYFKTLEISSASYGRWSTFDTKRINIKSEANILYELDG